MSFNLIVYFLHFLLVLLGHLAVVLTGPYLLLALYLTSHVADWRH